MLERSSARVSKCPCKKRGAQTGAYSVIADQYSTRACLRGVTREELDDGRYIARLANERRLREHSKHLYFRGAPAFLKLHLRFHYPWIDRVDSDSIRAKLNRCGLHERV